MIWTVWLLELPACLPKTSESLPPQQPVRNLQLSVDMTRLDHVQQAAFKEAPDDNSQQVLRCP